MRRPLSLVLVVVTVSMACRSDPSSDVTPGIRLAVANSIDIGRYVTDTSGRPLYVLMRKDAMGCDAECAKEWPPAPGSVPALESTEPAIQPELIGSTQRSDGQLQITYAKRPLHYRPSTIASDVQRTVTDKWGTWSLVFPHGEPFVAPP